MSKLDNAEAIAKIFDTCPNVDDLPESEAKANALDIQWLFTSGIDLLKHYPNKSISGLADLMWAILERKVVLVATSTGIDRITFVGYNRIEGFQQASILIPTTWVTDLEADEILQAGAIIGAGSKSIDFYNGLMAPGKENEFNARAQAYEAEFLLSTQKLHPDYTMGGYQKILIAKYPKGIHSDNVSHLIYHSKPFFMAEA